MNEQGNKEKGLIIFDNELNVNLGLFEWRCICHTYWV